MHSRSFKDLIATARRKAGLLLKPFRASMPESLRWLASQEIPVATVLDVGASDGRWSRQCMRHFPAARYVLFEPLEEHRPGLDAFKAGARAAVDIVPAAVGDASGTVLFDAPDAFGGALAEANGAHTLEVSATCIDDTVGELDPPRPFLLKLDTHGYESRILDGAARSLEHCSVLIIEAYNYHISSEALTFWELCARLREQGFRPVDLVDVMHRKHDGSLWQMDLVFVKDTWRGFDYIDYA